MGSAQSFPSEKADMAEALDALREKQGLGCPQASDHITAGSSSVDGISKAPIAHSNQSSKTLGLLDPKPYKLHSTQDSIFRHKMAVQGKSIELRPQNSSPRQFDEQLKKINEQGDQEARTLHFRRWQAQLPDQGVSRPFKHPGRLYGQHELRTRSLTASTPLSLPIAREANRAGQILRSRTRQGLQSEQVFPRPSQIPGGSSYRPRNLRAHVLTASTPLPSSPIAPSAPAPRGILKIQPPLLRARPPQTKSVHFGPLHSPSELLSSRPESLYKQKRGRKLFAQGIRARQLEYDKEHWPKRVRKYRVGEEWVFVRKEARSAE